VGDPKTLNLETLAILEPHPDAEQAGVTNMLYLAESADLTDFTCRICLLLLLRFCENQQT